MRWGSRPGPDRLPSVSFKGGILALEIPVLVVSWTLIHWTHLELPRLVPAGVGMTFYPHFGQQGPGPYPALPSPPERVEPALGHGIFFFFFFSSFQIFQRVFITYKKSQWSKEIKTKDIIIQGPGGLIASSTGSESHRRLSTKTPSSGQYAISRVTLGPLFLLYFSNFQKL